MKNEKLETVPKKKIIIYLNESSNTRAFGEDRKVHAAQFEKVTEWIDEAVKRETEDETRERFQETISILGSRGSGKTSFLYSLSNKYKENKDVAVIKIIDPTLIEQKGHIFLTIISQIKELVDDKLRSCECNIDSSDFTKRQFWEKKLESLAHGLPSVKGIGQPNEGSWQDPEYIMHKGLRAVYSARELEDNFHKFVVESLKILDKKVFLLMLDDIDVDFREGWPVLETLRKYFTTPRIVTLLSGDLDLFAKAVRKQQWKNFGKELLVNEGEKLNKIREYNDLVTEMESQYLQKVLKPQKRVRLNTLWEKKQIGSDVIKIGDKPSDDDKAIEVVEYYKSVLATYGIMNPTQAKTYYSFLMNQPLRTQIQWLSNERLRKSNEESYKLSRVDILEPFLSSLYEKQVNVEMANNMPEMLNIVILQLLLRERILSEAYQLQPTVSDSNINMSLVAFSLLFSEKVKQNPFLIFDYIIKIGYTSNLIDAFGYKVRNEQEVNSLVSPSIEGLCEHAEMFQENVLRNVVGNITAYLSAYLDIDKEEQSVWSGIIRLYGLALKAKDNKANIENRIDYVFKTKDLIQRSMAFFPLSLSRPNYKNTSSSSYSLFMLLGAIGEFLKFDDEKEINNHIKKLSQVRSYPMPNFKRSNTAYDGKIEIEEKEVKGDEPEDKTGEELAALIMQWKELYPEEKMKLSPYLLGKIVTRFYYALRSIEEKDDSRNLGDAMHWRIISFLHAVLLEDAAENLEDVSQFNHNNTNFSIKFFIDNLRKVKELHEIEEKAELSEETVKSFEKLQLSRWILSCPLLLLYLDFSELGKNEEFIWFITNSNSTIEDVKIDVFDKSIYENLKQVGTPPPDSNKPKFSGSEANTVKTVKILFESDPLSYSVLSIGGIEEIRQKYSSLFSNSIDISSVESLLKHATESRPKNNPLVKEWIAASALTDSGEVAVIETIDSEEVPENSSEENQPTPNS